MANGEIHSLNLIFYILMTADLLFLPTDISATNYLVALPYKLYYGYGRQRRYFNRSYLTFR